MFEPLYLLGIGIFSLYLSYKAKSDKVRMDLMAAALHGIGIFAIVGAAFLTEKLDEQAFNDCEGQVEVGYEATTDSIAVDTIVTYGGESKTLQSVISPKKETKKSEKTNKKFVTHVTLTVYQPDENQCDKTPLTTADNTKINLKKLKKGQLKYCAVSRDLLAFIPYGSLIEIDGHGVYEVHDTMHERYKHYVDILQHKSLPIFKKENIKITLLT